MKNHIAATQNRPEGERDLDDNMAIIDIREQINLVKSEDSWQKNDKNSITLFKSDHISIVLIALHENTKMRSHITEGIVSIHVVEGAIQFYSEKEDGSTFEIGKDQIIMLNKGSQYNVSIKEESTLLLTHTNI